MTNGSFPTPTQTMSRTEFGWLIGAIVFGSILRLSFPGRMAVEHFDEGVYASNFWFDAADDYSYPARYLYAPPLLPAAIEWTMTIASLCGIKPTGFIPMIPSLIAGIAMIPSVWWVCRNWFGPTAGLVSAWLVSASDFHVCYSRAALTDVPVCLFILWGVYFTGRAILEASSARHREARSRKLPVSVPPPLPWQWIFLAGVFTGLAWWTKYNGWLPLAIGLTSGVLWQFLTPRGERQINRMVTCWLLIAAVAFLFWLPVLWGLQKHGGYERVASNHRQYVVGVQGWGKSALCQMYNLGTYENPLDILYQPFRGRYVERTAINQEQRWWRLWKINNRPLYWALIQNGQWGFLFSNLQGEFFEFVTPLLVPVLSLILSATYCSLRIFRARESPLMLADCLVIAWFGGMTVATPFYYPYPRLVLPWLCSTWICLGVIVQRWSTRSTVPATNPGERLPHRVLTFLATGLIAITVIRLACGSAHAWNDRTSAQSISEKFAASVKRETAQSGFPETEAIVYVIGEPAIMFGMKAEGLPAVGPVQGLGFMQQPIVRPTFVAFPPRDSAMSREDREELGSWRFERVDGVPSHPSHLVILDDPGFGGSVGTNETKLFRLIK